METLSRSFARRARPVVAALVAALACGQIAPSALAQDERPAPPRWTDEQLAGAAELGKRVEADLRAGDEKAFIAAWDFEAITTAVLAGAKVEAKTLAQAREGALEGLAESLAELAKKWQGSATYKRVVVVDGVPMARFRFAGDLGIAINDFPLALRDGQWRIVDCHNLTVGLRMVDHLRDTMSALLAGIDRSWFERLYRARGLSPKDRDAFLRLRAEVQEGDHAGVITVYRGLPAALRDTLLATVLYVDALAAAGDDEAYAVALEAAAARHPAPAFRFLLVDAYWVREAWDKAIVCIDEFMQAVEPDAALLTLRALAEWHAGRVADAVVTLRRARELEPTCEYAHATGLDVLLAAKEWAAVRASMLFLEKNCGYDFRKGIGDDVWAEFRDQDEAKPWR